jgi:RimJ/RimL family protein N-acetyltransferase
LELRAATTTRIVLRGGRVVLIGPLDARDRERFVSGIGRASPESMYRRFMTPLPRLSRSQLAYLLGVDHRDHEALLAISEDDGQAVAVGRFVRLVDSPTAAEAAVLVIDDWQGVGLGKAVCRLLAERARALGIERFEATMLNDNRAMRSILESLGEIRVVAHDGPTVTLTVSLPERGTGEQLSGVLRAAGDGGYELAAADAHRPESGGS